MTYLRKGSPIPTKGKGSTLTALQVRFVEEFLIDLNASQAVIRAGYRTKNPNRIGTNLLQHPLVAKEIEDRTAARRERFELTADYVITKLMAIVEDTESGNPNAALRGLELLGKHLGLYKERQEISGPDGEAIEMKQKVQEDAADFARAIARLAERRGEAGMAEKPNTGTDG